MHRFTFDLRNCVVHLDLREGASEEEMMQAFESWWEHAGPEQVAEAVDWGDGPWLTVAGRPDGTDVLF